MFLHWVLQYMLCKKQAAGFVISNNNNNKKYIYIIISCIQHSSRWKSSEENKSLCVSLAETLERQKKHAPVEFREW